MKNVLIMRHAKSSWKEKDKPDHERPLNRDALLAILRDLPDELDRVMIIGHNPGLEALVQMLSHQVDALPTAAIAYLAIPVETWKDIKEDGDSQLVELWLPKDLKKTN